MAFALRVCCAVLLQVCLFWVAFACCCIYSVLVLRCSCVCVLALCCFCARFVVPSCGDLLVLFLRWFWYAFVMCVGCLRDGFGVDVAMCVVASCVALMLLVAAVLC